MLYILRSFQSQWFLKKFVPREKSSRLREMHTARFIIAARKRADPNRDDADKTNVEATDHA